MSQLLQAFDAPGGGTGSTVPPQLPAATAAVPIRGSLSGHPGSLPGAGVREASAGVGEQGVQLEGAGGSGAVDMEGVCCSADDEDDDEEEAVMLAARRAAATTTMYRKWVLLLLLVWFFTCSAVCLLSCLCFALVW